MRYLLVVLVCVLAHVAYGKPAQDDFKEWLENKEESALAEKDSFNENSKIVKRDVREENEAMAKLLLGEIIKELRKEAAYDREVRFSPDLHKEMVEQKRKAFWQPIGGPLPVETRLASFGSKIEPDSSRASSHAFKAMRYGRRR